MHLNDNVLDTISLNSYYCVVKIKWSSLNPCIIFDLFVIFCSWLLGPGCNSPSVVFVTAEGHLLKLYLAIIDARTLLPQLAGQKKQSEVSTKYGWFI